MPGAASDPVDTTPGTGRLLMSLIYVASSPPFLLTGECLLKYHTPSKGARKMRRTLAPTSRSSHSANPVGQKLQEPENDPLRAEPNV